MRRLARRCRIGSLHGRTLVLHARRLAMRGAHLTTIHGRTRARLRWRCGLVLHEAIEGTRCLLLARIMTMLLKCALFGMGLGRLGGFLAAPGSAAMSRTGCALAATRRHARLKTLFSRSAIVFARNEAGACTRICGNGGFVATTCAGCRFRSFEIDDMRLARHLNRPLEHCSWFIVRVMLRWLYLITRKEGQSRWIANRTRIHNRAAQMHRKRNLPGAIQFPPLHSKATNSTFLK